MNFVLIHGAFQGGWCWNRVRKILQEAGHEVFAPSLTGLGERKHLLDLAIGLDTHVQDVSNLLEFEDLEDVILVGHSYGGMVITGTCELASHRIGHLVYVDALMPRDGESNLDILDREVSQIIRQLAVDGWRVSPPTDALLAYLGIESAEDRSWMADRFAPQPLRTFEQPLPLPTRAAERAISKTYVHCTKPTSGRAYEKSAARAQGEGWGYFEMATAHEAMMILPGALAEILVQIANRTAKSLLDVGEPSI